jgi:hypothetical protein
VQFSAADPPAYAYEHDHTSQTWTPGVHLSYDQYKQINMKYVAVFIYLLFIYFCIFSIEAVEASALIHDVGNPVLNIGGE